MARLGTMLKRASQRIGWERERALCELLRPNRLQLPSLELSSLFADVDMVPVQVTQVESGDWSTPLADLIALLKLVVLTEPRRILELGSYRGTTAKAIAENLPEASVLAVDIDPDHGHAYRGLPIATRIERRVGAISSELFASEPNGSFDLIFVDADHAYESVKHDTEEVVRLIAPAGWFVWHDYANWGAFSGWCGVPEYLHELASEIPIVRIANTTLAVHRPCWRASDDDRGQLERALRLSRARKRGRGDAAS